jgi:hypothetical protein
VAHNPFHVPGEGGSFAAAFQPWQLPVHHLAKELLEKEIVDQLHRRDRLSASNQIVPQAQRELVKRQHMEIEQREVRLDGQKSLQPVGKRSGGHDNGEQCKRIIGLKRTHIFDKRVIKGRMERPGDDPKHLTRIS